VRVVLIAAMSADGFIGQNSSQSSLDWRSKSDSKFFIETTKNLGVMVMGSTTYKTFRMRRAPPGRRLIVYTTKPESISGENVETTNEGPAELVKRLNNEGARAIAICGGATINKLFMESGLVNELYLTVEPILFGKGIPLFSGELNYTLSLLEMRNLSGETILLHYAVNN
jgi:dihydrofolate reductase